MRQVKNAKGLKKQATLVPLSAAMTVQTEFLGYAAVPTPGNWQ